jgi:cytochrome b561
MSLYDNKDSYGAISRLNHWLGAAAILALLGIGLYFHEMPRGEERLYWLRLHVALGVLASAPLVFRVGWRFASRSPAALSQAPWQQWATHAVHSLLLAGIVALLVTGPLMVWSAGRPIAVFGWFAIPSPLGDAPALHEALETVHAVVSRLLIVAIGVHVLGALKHALFDRGSLGGRMFGRGATAVPRL